MEDAIALGKFISYIVYGMSIIYLIISFFISDNLKEMFIFTQHTRELWFSALIGATILFFIFCMTIQFPAWFLICLFWFSSSSCGC